MILKVYEVDCDQRGPGCLEHMDDAARAQNLAEVTRVLVDAGWRTYRHPDLSLTFAFCPRCLEDTSAAALGRRRGDAVIAALAAREGNQR